MRLGGQGAGSRIQVGGCDDVIVNVDKNQDFFGFGYWGRLPRVVHRGKSSEQRVTSGTV